MEQNKHHESPNTNTDIDQLMELTTSLTTSVAQAAAPDEPLLDNDYLRLLRRGDVAVICLDQRGRKVNTLSQESIDAMEAALEWIDGDQTFVGIALISEKSGGFVAGADLNQLRDVTDPTIARELSLRGQAVLKRLAEQSRPTVAALHGDTLGGGLELALACRYRIAADESDTCLGAPEVKLGLLPAGGGTQRLPRLVGLQQSLDMMLTGRNVYVKEALSMGLIDEVTHRDGLLRAACRAVVDLASGALTPSRDNDWTDVLLESNRLTRNMVYRQAQSQIEASTRGHYPAPPGILQCVRVGLEEGEAAGLASEASLFGQLSVTPEAQALLHIFFARREASSSLSQETDDGAVMSRTPPATVAVVGAGLMGAGIAQVTAQGAEVTVLLDDEEPAQIQQAFSHIASDVARQRDKGAIGHFAAEQIVQRLQPLLPPFSLSSVPLLMEAIPEDVALKQQVLKSLEQKLPADAVLATNTSSIPLQQLGRYLDRPRQLVGMHYFSPVNKMPLMELIRGPETDERALDLARRLGNAQGKVMIEVMDSPGFYTTRVLAMYTNEALLMLDHGAGVEQIDDAMKAWGFAMGPFEVLDQVGLPVAAKITEVLKGEFTRRNIPVSRVLPRMIEQGWRGQTSLLGFYEYTESNDGMQPSRGDVNAAVYRHTSDSGGLKDQDIQQALGGLFLNEAIRCLEEGVLQAPRDGDLGAVLGLGFPPFRGGPFRWCDQCTAAAIVEQLDAFAIERGVHFLPTALLRQMAAEDRSFYPSFQS